MSGGDRAPGHLAWRQGAIARGADIDSPAVETKFLVIGKLANN